MTDTRTLSITVNGTQYTREIETRRTLADFLRLDLKLTGTHLGCEHGVCGACTVRVEGQAVRSCLMLAVQANGKSVATVEGLARDGNLSPLQNQFWEHHGLQCGFCTPGVLMTMEEFLEENPNPTEADVRDALSGNICRCTGYQSIVDAVLATAAQARGE
ncbi:(2Fe-2S)-binding protein [Pelagibacterium lacus]|uniref:(2Fe-2S)-binding protein n=1 Tax=Pelagibacterium lacus TaxID=2282655 RepID=A0A369W302_9HYPH|nr:(2Fe-2S)-binding protein [Pelagibacterium lacus]RDE09046.1 (2Fe-2S)-binding protein [Pelagibacterium lacus]